MCWTNSALKNGQTKTSLHLLQLVGSAAIGAFSLLQINVEHSKTREGVQKRDSSNADVGALCQAAAVQRRRASSDACGSVKLSCCSTLPMPLIDGEQAG